MADLVTVKLEPDENAHWTAHCFTQHIDPEAMEKEVDKSKMKKELKEQVKTLIAILHCNERIIHYRTSINYFLEKIIEPCPNCHGYFYRIPSANTHEGSKDYYSCVLLCEKCKRHNVTIVLPYRLVVSYCHFYQLTPPEQGKPFFDQFPR